MKVILKIQNHTGSSEFKLENLKSVTIGRTAKSDLKIPDEHLSGMHLKLELNLPRLMITDLESKNGTYLNGIRIEQSDMFVGDELKIGSTKITIAAEKMEKSTLNALTFSGSSNDRAAHELKLDFTGARDMNHGQKKSQTRNPQSLTALEKELILRKRGSSKIKLTKHEIKLADKLKSSLASGVDTLFMVMSFIVPLILINYLFVSLSLRLGNLKMPILFITSLLFCGLFYLINFKWLKFSLGEKFAGIEKKYDGQDDSQD